MVRQLPPELVGVLLARDPAGRPTVPDGSWEADRAAAQSGGFAAVLRVLGDTPGTGDARTAGEG